MELQQSDIASLILHLRGEKVMLDSHIAMLYHVQTRVLKQAVKRNQARFPVDFMFELTGTEVEFLRSQNVISKITQGGLRYKPIAFTEQGIDDLESKYDKQFVLVFEAIKQLIHEESKPRNPISFRIKRDETG